MQKSVEIIYNNKILRGMLHIPDFKDGKVPLVVILHGFCGNKMGPHFYLVKLSRALEALGIASVRFDFSGSGESDGKFVDMTFSGELQESNVILDYAKSLDFIDINKIGLLGYSMGGALAGILAGSRKDEIKALCLLSPAGDMKSVFHNGFLGEKTDELIKKGSFDHEGFTISKKFADDISSIDIFDKSKYYDKKVLIIHGDDDSIVPIENAHSYLNIYGRNGSLSVIKGADHQYNSSVWETSVINQVKTFFETELK